MQKISALAKLFDRLRFELEYPSGTWTTIVPTVDDVVLSKSREKGKFLYRLNLETELLLRKAAWDYISEIETDAHCSEINIRLSCGAQTIYEGSVKLNDASFDFSNCSATIEANTDDDYSCIERGLKTEINIIPGDQTLKFFIGEIERQDCIETHVTGLNPPVYSGIDDCLSEADGWQIEENIYQNVTPSGPGVVAPFEADQETTWFRLTVDSATQPPGIGWTNIGGTTWVRPLVIVVDEDQTTSPPPEEAFWYQYWKPAFGNNESIDNGVRLDDLLQTFLNEIGCTLTIVSDFLGINPDFTAPSNDAYTAAYEKMQDVLIFQKSDVKRGDASNNATSGKMTLDELFTFLANGPKVFPSIVNGSLRLEHISYYEEKPISLDLTTAPYMRWMKRSRKYSYTNDDNPRFEKFSAMETTNNARFDGVPIEYGVECSSKDNDTVQHSLGRFVTDISSVITTPDSFSDDGFVVVNAIEFEGELYIDSEMSALFPADEVLNGHLSFPNLHDKYWRNYAYQASGLLNGVTIDFDSVRPSKRGVPITIPGWCCADFLNFDPASLVRTPIGDGEIEKITYSVKTGNVVFELIYPTTTTS